MHAQTKGARALFSQLKELMAQKIDTQQRLDTTVAMIANNMAAEVCSLYILRADGFLELFATKGLSPAAVHKAKLRIGQGLVGNIAKTAKSLNISNAAEHPNFQYLAETREDPFNSFLGVPIFRAGNTLGVLVIQNIKPRHYLEEEIEVLEVISMVIAEIIASSDFARAKASGNLLATRRTRTLYGVKLSSGIGIGKAILHEPRVVVDTMFSDDIATELQRFEQALIRMKLSVDFIIESRLKKTQSEHREVMEAYRMVANDHGWANRIKEAIKSGLTAEAAVEKVQNDNRAMLEKMANPYMRDRLYDFDDLAYRLLRELTGIRSTIGERHFGSETVIVARAMGPAELFDYADNTIHGLVLEEGSPNAHVNIIARSLNIPVVGRVRNVVSLVEEGDEIIVDANNAQVILRPPTNEKKLFGKRIITHEKRQQHFHAARALPAVTKDKHHIKLLLNAGLPGDIDNLDQSGADGIGLFRTELLFLTSHNIPKRGEQIEFYSKAFAELGNRMAVFRTIDIGGDKLLDYLNHEHTENPAMGWRAIRLTLHKRGGLLRWQAQALLRAAAGNDLRLMFPMITSVSEFKRAKAMVELTRQKLIKFGYETPKNIFYGAMLEVPSLIFELKYLLQTADFISIGTNDFLQFFFASDRSDYRLNERYHPLSAPVLRALAIIVKETTNSKTPVTVCGELAGTMTGAMALIGLGFTSLSMDASSIGPIKDAILHNSRSEFAAIVYDAIDNNIDGEITHNKILDLLTKQGLTI